MSAYATIHVSRRIAVLWVVLRLGVLPDSEVEDLLNRLLRDKLLDAKVSGDYGPDDHVLIDSQH